MTTERMARRLSPPVDVTRDHVFGPEDAPVTLVEYGDYECPYCRQAHRVVIRLRDEGLAGRMRYVFRHLPNRRIHPRAELAAEAAEAAGAQGKFWEMHDYLFTHEGALDRETIVDAARAFGLDVELFARDLDEGAYTARVDEDLASAERSGARVTPTFFIDSRRYDGPWDQESLLDAVRKPLGWRIRLLAEQFAGLSTSSGLLMLLGVVVALVWANSPWRAGYDQLWSTRLAIGLGHGTLAMSLESWVNDGLIVLFFLVVALEIRREVTVGDLSTPQRAALPIAAALGGMLCPALIYLLFNRHGPASHGWGVPMGTDTAFALGLLAVLGPRVPLQLRVFVAAAAIADDVGSIVVLALFYTAHVSLVALGAAAALWLLAFALNRARVYRPLPYAVVGVLMWLAVLHAGMHPTLAGVMLAFSIPTRAPPNTAALLAQTESLLQSAIAPSPDDGGAPAAPVATTRVFERVVDRMVSPAQRLARNLQPWSAYVVLPLFAFANAGIALHLRAGDFLEPVSLGIALGLLVGKPTGITVGAWLAARSGLATKPAEIEWAQLAGAGVLCGIGFTMAFFIAGLAFTDTRTLGLAKVSVLAASVIAAAAGWATLQVLHYRRSRRPAGASTVVTTR